MRILIGDSCEKTRLELRTALSSWGYNIIDVASGSLARDLILSPHTFDAVILDWNLPDLDGPHIIRLIKSSTGESFIYSALMAGTKQENNIAQAYQLGADDFYSKPLCFDTLQLRMRSAARLVSIQKEMAQNPPVREHYQTLDYLARRVAHGVNTPLQFMGDSLGFLEESFRNLVMVVQAREHERGDSSVPSEQSMEIAEIEMLLSEIPKAFERSKKGLERVAQFIGELPFLPLGSFDKDGPSH